MVTLPMLTPEEELLADYTVSGLSARYHPIELARPRLPPEVATARGSAACATAPTRA